MAATEEDLELAFYPDQAEAEVPHEHWEKYWRLLHLGIWSDVTFIVGKEREEFKVHKLVLRSSSKEFNELFNANKDKDVFEVLDLEPHEFKLMLEFLYTGKCTKNVEDGLALLRAATKYDVSDLIDACGKLVGGNLTEDNCLEVYQQALKYQDDSLIEKSLDLICRFGTTIIESSKFLELSVEELTGIVARDDLIITNEVQLFDAVMNWARAECRRQQTLETHKYLRSMMEKVIPHIRFPLMDPTEFAVKVASTNVLLTEELVSILLYFSVKQESRASLPPGMFNPKPRAVSTPDVDNSVGGDKDDTSEDK